MTYESTLIEIYEKLIDSYKDSMKIKDSIIESQKQIIDLFNEMVTVYKNNINNTKLRGEEENDS